MANPSIHQGDHVFYGTISASGMDIPAGGVDDAAFSSATGDRLSASKAVHQFSIRHALAGGTDVVASTMPIHVALGAGTVAGVKVGPITAPTGGDKAFTVDVKKSTAGGAFATILTSVVTVNSSSTNNTPQTGTLVATPTYVAGDMLEVVIAVSGTTGSQGQGVVVTVFVQENPS